MMEMFTRTYIDTSEFPHKVKMNTLKEGEYVYEVRLVREPLCDGVLETMEPIETLQIVKRQVDEAFTFGDLKYLGKKIYLKKWEAEKYVEEARKELGW